MWTGKAFRCNELRAKGKKANEADGEEIRHERGKNAVQLWV
jgi:hypothetical protein